MSRPIIRWGILGTGMIAEKFAQGLSLSQSGEPRAIASRNSDKAGDLIQQLSDWSGVNHSFDVTEAVEGYEVLIDHPDVDAVYIALPNHLHKKWTINALRAGKHVLCEKPLALNAAEAEELFAVASEEGRVLIEAFMYRALPQTTNLLESIWDGLIGDLRIIRANFTFNREASPHDARYQAENGGGSLMDVGCYCIDFARSLTGTEPIEMNATFHQHELGVDDYAAGTLAFPNDVLMTFTCGMTVTSDQTAHIAGTEGRIEIPRFWFGEEGYSIIRLDGKTEIIPGKKNASRPVYAAEADAFADVVGGAENWNPPENTIGNMRVLDALRK